MASNYDKMAQQAAELFLRLDQKEMIDRWELEADEDFLYVPYFSAAPVLRVDRRSGQVSYTEDFLAAHPREAGADLNNAAMVVYDLLTYAKERPTASGNWASISDLGGIIGSGHETTLHPQTAQAFAGRTAELENACAALGAERMDKGDVSFVFTVFRDFRIWFQFWDADEEFPAAIKYLFDENALQYMHYETLWYAMGELVRYVEREMGV